jgi:glyoxylase-like metal-dependent hydrolase (beta-lactamase superfamily II)
VLVVDAQATPKMAHKVIEYIRTVTDKPIKYVVLSHYHAVRVLGASGFEPQHIICSEATRDMIVERGAQDYKSELQRFPRLFDAAETIPGLTWPTITFNDRMTIWLGKLQIDIIHAGRGHTKGDTIVWLPEERTLFSGDLVEYGATPYAGDAHYKDWPETLQKLRDLRALALVPGRGDALVGEAAVEEGIAGTQAFLSELYKAVTVSAEAGLRQGDVRPAAALRQLGDLRALHAVRRVACLRRGQGPRPSTHLDRRARHRDVGGTGEGMMYPHRLPRLAGRVGRGRIPVVLPTSFRS